MTFVNLGVLANMSERWLMTDKQHDVVQQILNSPEGPRWPFLSTLPMALDEPPENHADFDVEPCHSNTRATNCNCQWQTRLDNGRAYDSNRRQKSSIRNPDVPRRKIVPSYNKRIALL